MVIIYKLITLHSAFTEKSYIRRNFYFLTYLERRFWEFTVIRLLMHVCIKNVEVGGGGGNNIFVAITTCIAALANQLLSLRATVSALAGRKCFWLPHWKTVHICRPKCGVYSFSVFVKADFKWQCHGSNLDLCPTKHAFWFANSMRLGHKCIYIYIYICILLRIRSSVTGMYMI